MIDREQVAKVLDEVRVMLQMHGGDAELVEVSDDGVVQVRLQGACNGCPMAQLTIKKGVEARLKEAIPEVREVVAV